MPETTWESMKYRADENKCIECGSLIVEVVRKSALVVPRKRCCVCIARTYVGVVRVQRSSSSGSA